MLAVCLDITQPHRPCYDYMVLVCHDSTCWLAGWLAGRAAWWWWGRVGGGGGGGARDQVRPPQLFARRRLPHQRAER